MKRMVTRHLTAVAAMCLSSIVVADEFKDAGLTIEAQPLASALREFSEQTGLQIGYAAELADGKETQGVEGVEDPGVALDTLLASSGLEHRFVNDETVVIRAVDAVAEQEVSSDSGKSRPASNPVLMAQNQTSALRNQTNNDDEDEDEEAPRKMEEILVTGSRIRGAQSASPVVTITRQEIDRAGFATVEELVDKLPQNFGAGASLDTSTDFLSATRNAVGGNADDRAGGASVNLRGLGASSTLVLLNGRRMSPSGHTARFTNVSSIPVTAIERVEVLTDGASAIYGSDAIGGVVNFILREDYEGAETRLRYGSDGSGDMSNTLFGQSFGKSWDDGNVLFTYEYYDSDNLASSDRDITSTTDLSRFGGTDWRTPGGNPANIVAGGQTFAIPAGQDGTALTPADFDLAVPPNRYNVRSVVDVLPAQERHSAFLHLTHSIGKTELFAEAQFSDVNRLITGTGGTLDIIVPNTNPFFVDPTDSGLTSVRVERYSFDDDVPSSKRLGEIDSFGTTLGGRFNIATSWNGELVGSWYKEEAKLERIGRLNIDAVNAAVNQTVPDLAFNPFGDGSSTNSAVLESLVDRTTQVMDQSENELWQVSLNVDGKAFDVPGGAAQVAVGFEFREESLLSETIWPQEIRSDTSRDILAAYAEFFFPLVSSANSRPLLQRLELSMAGRYEDYSDFGSSTNPKVSLLWSPTQALILRGTYGTSFRAPALFDLDVTIPQANSASYAPQLLVDLGLIPFPIIVRRGGNEGLTPEEATTWTAGVQWSPERIKRLSVDMTYFNVDFEDRIDSSGANITTGSMDPRFATIFNANPTPEQIAALVNDPRWQETISGLTTPAEDVLSGAAPVGGILDLRKTNLAQTVVTGVDLQLSYQFETTLGLFDAGLSGNYLFDFKRRLLAADPLVEEVDTLGRPVDFRGRGNVTWSRGAWAVAGFVNYMDGYTNNVSDPEAPINSWTTVDLAIVYDTGDAGINGWFADTRLSLTTQNLLDEDPPFVDAVGGTAYDSTNADPRGRFLSFQLTKEW